MSNFENKKEIKTDNPLKNKNNPEKKLKLKIKNITNFCFHNLLKISHRTNYTYKKNNEKNSLIIYSDLKINLNYQSQTKTYFITTILSEIENFQNLCLKYEKNITELKKHIDFEIQNKVLNLKLNKQLQEKLDEYLHIFQQEKNFSLSNFQQFIHEKINNITVDNFYEYFSNTLKNYEKKLFEQILVNQIENKLQLNSYENTFPLARKINRKFKILLGPTNSGKTFTALNYLSQANTGAYLAPLRLMAQEGQESLFERGILANLITGEEKKIFENATHSSSTVEICDFNTIIDCAVIDEIQMLSDPNRGWAWSQAFIGVPAKQVVLVGSKEALPYIIQILKLLNEEYEIIEFERKTPLNVIQPLNKIKSLKAGDCVIAFSRKNAISLKNEVERHNKECSIIYGNLSPEVRKQEALNFKNEKKPILIATDAIGMGLNLPIKRLFFSTLFKFDGQKDRILNTSEIKQISGRAGRFGFNNAGEVGMLFNENSNDTYVLQKAINGKHDEILDSRIYISPNFYQTKYICDEMKYSHVYKSFIFFKNKMILNNMYYKSADLENMIETAISIKDKNLDLENEFIYSCSPIDTKNEFILQQFLSFISQHTKNNFVKVPDLNQAVQMQIYNPLYLYDIENYVKLLMCYKWLHYKYPDIYSELEIANKYILLCNEHIEKCL